MDRSLYRPFLVYFVLFGVLFLLHILFAMYSLELLFEVVAFIITISVFFMGPIVLLFSQNRYAVYDEILFSCLCFSPILGFGLGWAYSGMEFTKLVIVFSFVNTLFHLGYKRGFKYLWGMDRINA